MNEKNLKIKVSQNRNSVIQNIQTYDQFQFIKDIHECQMVLRTYRLRLDKLVNENKKLMNSIVSFKDSQYYINYKKEYINASKPEKLEEEYKKTYKVNEVKLKEYSFLSFAISELKYYPIKLPLMGIVPAFLIDIILINLTHDTSGLTIFPGILTALIIYFIYISKGLKKENAALKREYEDAIKSIEYAKTSEESNKKSYNYWKEEYTKYHNKQKEEVDNKVKENKREIQFLVDEYKRIKEIINQMYNLRIDGRLCLHPNYRGFVPISIIYGYFDTGRCSQLEGHEGAYNLYEDEKIKGMIIEKLDSILKQINKLNGTMLYVGKTIEECNDRLSELESSNDRMISSVNNMNSNISKQLSGVSGQISAVEENIAHSAYYAEVGARMTTFNSVYNLLKD